MPRDPAPIAIDFETEAIEDRPRYPPRPVGVSIARPGKKEQYLAFGHPTGNNCSVEVARTMLADIYRSGEPLAFHNGKFDQEVAWQHWDLPPPDWRRTHDTMLLAYLDDPHQRQIDLKATAHRVLGVEPTERDELRDWVIANVPEARRAKAQWGAYISRAPGALVGAYAKADTRMTAQVHRKLHPAVLGAGMGEAYDRERRLIVPMLNNERRGVRVDLPLLERDVAAYDKQLEKCDAWIRKTLKTPDLNVDSNDELADALEGVDGMVGEWLATPKGKRSTSKESLAFALKDPRMIAVLEYRGMLNTCLTIFMRKWLGMARETGGWVHFNWKSTSQPEGGGTRSGRLSSSPNAQNIVTDENLDKAEKALRSYAAFKGWLPLPHVRRYIICDRPGWVLLDRDFSQQELRMLAHYEQGAMMAAYIDNPRLDLHEFAAQVIKEKTGLSLPRKATKTIAFGLMYGMGAGKLAMRLGVTVDEAQRASNAYLNAFPGVAKLKNDLKQMGLLGMPLRTWGGRLYYAEEPKIINGVLKRYEYKLLNYLIQPSSADFTKEAWLQYEERKQHGRFVLTVHDELMICAPRKAWKSEMKILRECMNGLELNVPMLSDGEMGERWFEMEECE